jgi:hypothetical protein
MKHVIAFLFVAFAAVLVTSCSDSSIESAVNNDVAYAFAEQAAKDAKNTYCDSLHFELRKVEKGSDEAKAIMALIKDSCEKVRKPNPCDSLRMKLKSLDKDSDEFKRAMAIYKKKCNCDKGDKRDSTMADTVNCDRIATKLKTLDKESHEFKKLAHFYKEHCLGEKDDKKGKRKPIKEDADRKPPKKGDRITDAEIEKE